MKNKQDILVTLFYHGVDLDGWCSSALIEYFAQNLKQFEGKNIHFRFNEWNYGFKLFDKHYINSDYIFMTDIVLPEDDMIILSESLETPENFYVFDHHSTKKDLVEKLKADKIINKESICESSNCATYHTFQWIEQNLEDEFSSHSESRILNISTVINMVDLWDTHNYVQYVGKDDEMVENVKNFKSYVESVDANINCEDGRNLWHKLFDLADDEEEFYIELNTICTYGEIIKSAHIHQLNGLVPIYSFPAEFEGYKVICINSLPSICSDYMNDWENAKKYDLICTFYFNSRKSEWSFSFRKVDGASEDIDLIPLFEKYNKIRSGGHKGAGSIRCKSFSYEFASKKLELLF